MFRTLAEINDFVKEISSKDLPGLKSTMKKELESIFTKDVDKLFNIEQYEIIYLVDSGNYHFEGFSPKNAH
jgi:hypothetical protein